MCRVISNRMNKFLFTLIIYTSLSSSLFAQRATINQLQVDLHKTSDDSIKAKLYKDLADIYRPIHIDSAIYYIDSALLIAKKGKIGGDFINKNLIYKGVYHFEKKAYRQALKWTEEGQSLSKDRNDTLSIVLSYMVKGHIYGGMERKEKALDNYQLALDMLLQMGNSDKLRQAEIWFNLSNDYFWSKEYEKALTCYETSRKIALENEDKSMVALASLAIGEVYFQQGRLDTATILFNHVKDSLQVDLQKYTYLGPIITNTTYSSLTKSYLAQAQYKKALLAATKNLAFCEEHELHANKIGIYESLAKIHHRLKDYTSATNQIQKGLQTVKKINLRGGELPFYLLLSEVHEAKNQLQDALEIQRKYRQLKDSLNQLQVEEKIANLEYATEAEQKEAENALLTEEKKNQALTIRQKNYAIAAISLGLLSLGFILMQMYMARKKQKQLNQQLATQANELKQNQLFKNRLFGNIAHELRTPLTLITGQLDLISKESPVDLKVQQKLQIAKNTSQDLLGLTNQILDLTKSEVGLVKTTVSNFPLLDLLNYLQLQFEPIAQRKDIALQFTTTDEKVELSTDAEKLLTILRNLLSNALKYNQAQGRIKLDCKKIGTDIEIVVEDSGQGIPQADLSLIFDRYYQSQQTQTAEGGIGVGLAICKEYIQLLGGTIRVQSTLGKGSSFIIRFPQKMTTNTLNIPKYEFPKYLATTYPELPRLQTANESIEEYVLVVEDNLELSHYIYELLQEEHTVYFAANGQEALQQIDLQAPIAIITDWMMPVMDGAALIKHLKNSENFATIPVLMLTARTDIKEQLAVLRIGLDDYLTKPFDATVLKAHLNHLIEQTRQQLHIRKEDELMNQLETRLLAFDPKEQELLKQVEQIVLKNIASFDLTLEKISQIIGLSERHLSRKIKQLTKLTANQFVNEIRFREAKRMLLEKEYTSVKAVVYSVGFKSEKVFSRNFKKRFGKYPKELLS